MQKCVGGWVDGWVNYACVHLLVCMWLGVWVGVCVFTVVVLSLVVVLTLLFLFGYDAQCEVSFSVLQHCKARGRIDTMTIDVILLECDDGDWCVGDGKTFFLCVRFL